MQRRECTFGVFLQVPMDGMLTIEEGRDVTLECALQGENAPQNTNGSVRWNREGSKFRDGSYTFNGDLQISLEDVTRDDAGKYFCTATSTQGNKSNK